MTRRFVTGVFCLSFFFLSVGDSWAQRGGGRGGRGGGGGFSGGGGGFSGGASRGGAGFSGGARPSPSYSGGVRPSSGPSFNSGARPSPGQFSGGSVARPSIGGAAGIGGGARPSTGAGVGGAAGIGGGVRPGAGAGVGGAAGIGGGVRPGTGVAGTAGNANAASRFNAPSQSQLGSFLGLPSNEGIGHASNTSVGAMSSASQLPAGGNFDVNYGSKQGAGGGQAAGVTVTGPGGNTIGKAAAVGPQGGAAVVGGAQGAGGGTAARGVAVGPNGGAAAVGGVQGPNGGAAARGVAVGPNGQVVAGRGAVGPGGFGGGGVVTAGPAGVGAGFTRVTPSGRYTAAAAVRGNYNNWGIYGPAWGVQYPGAWFAAGWTANAIWNSATWGSAATYCGYAEQPPVYYDYGSNVVYEDSVVYVNGDSVGTTEQYYDQAVSIASTGGEAAAASDEDWLPLGVFAFTKPENPNSDITIQLAVNKEGILRGNYTDTASKQNQVIQGSIDKQSQRAAFTVGDNKTNIIETGLYNLTKDEAPCLLHIGKDQTEQWLMVRLNNPEAAAS
jgi:hypothetical protein